MGGSRIVVSASHLDLEQTEGGEHLPTTRSTRDNRQSVIYAFRTCRR